MKTNSRHQKILILVVITAGWILWGFLTGYLWYYQSSDKSIVPTLLITKIFQIVGGVLMSIVFYPLLAAFRKYGGSIKWQVLFLPFLIYFFSFVFAFIYWTVFRWAFNNQPLFISLSDYLVLSFDKFFVLSFFTLLYYLFQYWQEIQLHREAVLNALAEAKQAQLQMLRYQLNPHFLFNALNTIRTIMYEDTKRADKMITEVAGILRYSLTEETIHLVPFRSELEIIRSYLSIQQSRFEENLIINYDVQPETLDFQLPAFLAHPLVENSIKYGMHTGSLPLQIKICSKIENGFLFLKVSNSGKIYTKDDFPELQLSSTGTGHKNIKSRLEYFFPGNHTFQFLEEDGYVHAVISIALGQIGKKE
jgi:LytS/YehU family sensor histidine kinase